MNERKSLHILIATNIRHRRQMLGLSQEELADNCGLHRTYIGSIERGERNITVNTLQRVAEALSCSVIDLFYSGDIENEF
ncbi:helix-turn-helix domain-containing protein [Thalassospira xianhensis]|uniref:helix-turn-helix domain-containing protein n=1 Tax=Thalassospira xianhensis TaxID=478503 RepID=UPI000DED4C46|nr:helix-turn-helix transcriptional regulator [Thalassospira xianhensis]